MAVWDELDELKVVLARLRDQQPGTLMQYPMPDVARDLVAQISAAQLELAREQVRQDLAVELASPPVPDPVMVQADPSGISEYTAPPPGALVMQPSMASSSRTRPAIRS